MRLEPKLDGVSSAHFLNTVRDQPAIAFLSLPGLWVAPSFCGHVSAEFVTGVMLL
jgi:hypothetical protein